MVLKILVVIDLYLYTYTVGILTTALIFRNKKLFHYTK